MRKIVFVVLAAALLAIFIVSGTAQGQGGPPPPPPPPPGTLQPPCPPSGCPTATPTITPTPTDTPTPTATPTPIPLTLSVRLAHSSIAPRSKQKVTVRTLPDASVKITVHYPNGDKKSHSATAGPNGGATWTYTQPGSRITRSSNTAKVTVQVSDATDNKSSTKKYSIGFAALDVSVEPRSQKRGSSVAVWTHTSAGYSVIVQIRSSKGLAPNIRGKAAANGWAYGQYFVPSTAPTGSVNVWAYGYRAGKYAASGQTSFRIR